MPKQGNSAMKWNFQTPACHYLQSIIKIVSDGERGVGDVNDLKDDKMLEI